MSRLEELINKLCPDGVEFVKIGDICTLVAGGDVPKEFFSKEKTEDFQVPIYSNGIGENALYGYTNIEKVKAPCVTISARGTIGYCELREENFYPIIRLVCATPKIGLNAKYLKYCVDIIKFAVPTTGIPQLTVPMVSKYSIPLPPLPVQEEIVRILDNMTLLTTELNEKLAEEKVARQKQYEYYRDSLLSFEGKGEQDGVRWMKLGDIGRVAMCKRILKQETSPEGDIPFYKIGTFGKEPDAFISKEKFEEYKNKYSYPNIGDILISASGTIGRTVIFDGKPSYYQDSNIVWLAHDESIVLNKYLFHCYKLNPWAVSSGGTIARLYNDNINKAEIPVPPLEEQQRIVDILDRFDKLCNDISEGLPSEFEARKKQYEYYRDKLLTFKEKET